MPPQPFVHWQELLSFVAKVDLKVTWFRPEVQNKILDLLFDGEASFGKHIDALRTLRKTLRQLAL